MVNGAPMRISLCAIVFLCFSNQLFAYCEGGKSSNLSIADEIKQTSFIVIGTVTQQNLVVDPVEDPQGYEAVLFRVSVESIVYGKAPSYVSSEYLTLYTPNTSSRYQMEIGQKHLLFVSEGADGFWINSCGNSTEYKKSKPIIQTIKSLVDGKDQ